METIYEESFSLFVQGGLLETAQVSAAAIS
jgi:hypothetical protein